MAGLTLLSDAERLDWVRLARTSSIGPVTFASLLSRFGSPKAALDALPGLARRAGRKRKLVIPDTDEVKAEIDATQAYGARLVAHCEPDYPQLLRMVDPPPPILTISGSPALFEGKAVAIVGARNASAAGRKITRDIAEALGQAGFIIVSGLALGIDGEAHGASLATGTVAVLGGGINHIYPRQHDNLYHAIREQGAIVSESPFGHQATARDFPRRNRIITGLCLGTIVVEAAERSGSLISARTANEQGREVMAVPGSPLEPRAQGTNRLIREGATLVRSPDDVLEVLGMLGQTRLQMPNPPLFEDEEPALQFPEDQISAVYQALSLTPLPIDEIARAAGLGSVRCAAILVELELSERAVTLSGGLAMRAL